MLFLINKDQQIYIEIDQQQTILTVYRPVEGFVFLLYYQAQYNDCEVRGMSVSTFSANRREIKKSDDSEHSKLQ